MAEFTAKKVSKVKGFDADSSFSIEGMDTGTFAIATSKQELKQLMTSDADVVYDEKKGKLYLNENGEENGWGAKKVGGLLAKLKGKPELSAEGFDGITAHQETSTNTGGDFASEFQTYRDGLSDAKESKLYSEALINPKKGVKKIAKDAKKVGYEFDKDELGEALDEMNQQGAFIDVEADAAALDAMVGQGGGIMSSGKAGC
jgi:hypothetical protein